MGSKFEVYKDNGGMYRFRLKAINGQVLACGKVDSSPREVTCKILSPSLFSKQTLMKRLQKRSLKSLRACSENS